MTLKGQGWRSHYKRKATPKRKPKTDESRQQAAQQTSLECPFCHLKGHVRLGLTHDGGAFCRWCCRSWEVT